MARSRAIVRYRSTGRRPKSRGRRRRMMFPPLLTVASFLPGVADSYNLWKASSANTSFWERVLTVSKPWSGLDRNPSTTRVGWSWSAMSGTRWVMLGMVGHYLMNRLGVNRMLARNRIPFAL